MLQRQRYKEFLNNVAFMPLKVQKAGELVILLSFFTVDDIHTGLERVGTAGVVEQFNSIEFIYIV